MPQIPAAAFVSYLITAGVVAKGSFAAILIFNATAFAISAAASAAASYLLRPDLDTNFGALSSQGVRQNIKQSLPRQRLLYGTATTGGAFFFYEKKPPYLYIGYLVAAHECDGFEEIYLNGNRVNIDANGDATSAPFYNGQSFFRASVRLGTADQAIDPLLNSAFTGLDANFRQRGITTVVMRYDYGSSDDEHREIWGEGINPLFRFRGKKIFDPRDASQDPDDETTWKWNDNAALVTADMLRHPFLGDRDTSHINYDALGHAADICDAHYATRYDDPIKRYTINGVVDTAQRPFDVISSAAAAMQGDVIRVCDCYRIEPGALRDPEVTISQGDLVSGFEYRAQNPRRRLVNVLRTEFIADSSRDYTTQNGPVLEMTSYITADGQRLEQTIQLPFTEHPSRVQRIGKSFLESQRLGRALSVTVSPKHLRIIGGTLVRIDFDDFPNVNGIYKATQVKINNTFTEISIDLVEVSNSVYAWDPTTDEQDFTLDPPAIVT